jgi:hypothetical protein
MQDVARGLRSWQPAPEYGRVAPSIRHPAAPALGRYDLRSQAWPFMTR